MSTPAEWRRIAAENRKKDRYGLSDTLDRLADNDASLTVIELAGWTYVAPDLLAESLLHNSVLTRLSLQACRLGDEGLQLLCPVLQQGTLPLQSLDVSGNGITDNGAVALGQALTGNKTLKELLLSWNGIANAGTIALARVVESSPLEILDLAGVSQGRGGSSRDNSLRTHQLTAGMGDSGCARLAQALSHSKCKRLILSRHHGVTATGILSLSSNMVHSQHLVHLELQRIPVTDDGAVALADAIAEASSTLKTLDLTINKISNRGAKALAHSLTTNTTLTTLNLTQNAIQLEGLQALEAAAAVNTTLDSLQVYGHAAGKEGSVHVWRIKPWLRINRSSRQLIKGPEQFLTPLIARLAKQNDPERLFRLLKETPLVVGASQNATEER